MKKEKQMYIIKEYMEGRGSPKRIGEVLGIAPQRVVCCARYNGVAREYRRYTQEELDIIEEERAAGGSYVVRAAKRLGRKYNNVRQYINFNSWKNKNKKC